PTPGSYPLSLHDALPIYPGSRPVVLHLNAAGRDEQNQALVNDFFLRANGRDEIVVTERGLVTRGDLTILETADLLDGLRYERLGDRKSTRLNSSHVKISY